MVEAISQDMDDYVDRMRFPVLFQRASDDTSTMGLGALPDLLDGGTDNDINAWDTFSFTYKLDGINADKIAVDEVIMYDSSPNKLHQLYRITQVTPTLEGIQVSGVSILGDFLAANPVKKLLQFESASANAAWSLIADNLEYAIPQIVFDSDCSKVADINFPAATNATNLLLDPDQEGDTQTQSIVALFGGYIDGDNFTIHHRMESGVYRNYVIKYSDNLKTITQDKSIEGAYTGAYFHASYTPGQAHANQTNVDWANYEMGWASIGTVTYAVKGDIDIYDSPVAGHHKIGTLSRGQKLQVGKPLTDGTMVPSIANPNTQLQVDTVNGDTWYPIFGGGWIDGNWLTFDKSGDYLVSNVQGHGHVDITATDQPGTKFPVKGTAVVTYIGDGDKIHIYYSPFKGKDHYRILDPKTNEERTLKNGETITFHYEAIDENGHPWYQIGSHEWVYGPHLSISKENSIASYAANGVGYVKENAQKYIVNKKGKVVAAPKHTQIVSSKGKHTKAFTYVKRKINGKTRKVKKGNRSYFTAKKKKVKTTVNSGYTKIHSQTVEGGTTYYNVGGGVLVKSSDIDWKKRRSVKPKTPSQIIKNSAIKDGKIEIYAEPRKNSAINWAVDTNTALDIQNQATGDGETWDYVTFAGKSGWIMDKYVNYSADEDFEPTTIKDTSTDDDGAPLSSDVDQQQVLVELPEGTIIADSCIGKEAQRIQDVDLSAYIHHNDEDLSGQQPDGTFKATDDDINQLRTAAYNWMAEHRIGEIPVSLNLTAAQLRKMDGDLQTYEKGDIVSVYFPQAGITEQAPVTHTHYNWITHEYDEIQIGDPPKTYEHLLKEATDKSVDSLRRTTNAAVHHTQNIIGQVNNALALQGSDQKAAWENLMVQLGDAHYKTDTTGKKHLVLDESIKAFAQHMTDMANNVNSFNSFLQTGPKSVLHFVDDSGNENFQSPTAIRAGSDSGPYFELNSNGISYRSSNGTPYALFGVDQSSGKPVGNFYVDEAHIPVLDASHIETDTIHSLGTINGVLHVQNHGISIAVGNATNLLNPSQEIGGLSLDSPNYTLNLGSGSVNIHDKNSGAITHIGPNQAQIGGMNVVVTSSDQPVLGSWIKKYWQGPSKYWNL